MNCTLCVPRGRRLIVVSAAMFLFALSAYAQSDVIFKPTGGDGGGPFEARCPQGQLLTGVDLLTGDDADAIKPLCVKASGSNEVGPAVPGGIWFGGKGGPKAVRLICPTEEPFVVAMYVDAQGVATVIVNHIGLTCGRVDGTWSGFDDVDFFGVDHNAGRRNTLPSVLGWYFSNAPDRVPSVSDLDRCPAGLLGVGITGRSGVWLDAVGLICGEPPFAIQSARTPNVKEIGRVKLPPGAAGSRRPVCDVAAEARARNSPAAPGLEENCRAILATIGAAIAQADPIVAGARAAETDAMFRQGFDVASGIFGDLALGAQGNTATGPKSLKIRDLLSAAGQRGFDASVKLHLSRNYKH